MMIAAACLAALALPQEAAPVSFEKIVLTDKYYCDGINAGDVNGDGKPDVVAGPFWYEGPDFRKKHEFYPAVVHPTEPSPTNSMFSYLHDFNGDGRLDILKLGRVHKHQALWFENPGDKAGPWKEHVVFERVRGESPPFVDLDGDGKPEIVSHWDNRWGWIRPKSGTFRPISKQGEYHQFYHGTGVGDVNGDGRPDIVINDGWWENSDASEWTWHPQKFGERGGAQIGVYDVDGDGDSDVVSSLNAHLWGLAWFEQVNKDGARTFVKHVLMGDRSEEAKYGVAFSQPHAMDYADVDGDGLTDIVVGKRMWAHGPKGDVEPNAAPVVYWFRLVRENGRARFVPHLIDDKSGVGVQIRATDVNGDGRIDILTASKLGSFVFLNRKAQDNKVGDVTIHPVSHATMVLEWNGKTIYVDPVGGGGKFAKHAKPDLILVTDIHGDHLNGGTLEAVSTDATTIIAPAAVMEKIPGSVKGKKVPLANGASTEAVGATVEAIPMYNLTEERKRFHTKGRGNGYILTLGGKRFYISGDTEDIPEMRALKNIDAAFVCMNLPYTMTVDRAADAVLEFTPKVVFPYHYRGKGGMSDVGKFKSIVSKNPAIQVRQLNWYP